MSWLEYKSFLSWVESSTVDSTQLKNWTFYSCVWVKTWVQLFSVVLYFFFKRRWTVFWPSLWNKIGFGHVPLLTVDQLKLVVEHVQNERIQLTPVLVFYMLLPVHMTSWVHIMTSTSGCGSLHFASYAAFPSADIHVWLPSQWHPSWRCILHIDF